MSLPFLTSPQTDRMGKKLSRHSALSHEIFQFKHDGVGNPSSSPECISARLDKNPHSMTASGLRGNDLTSSWPLKRGWLRFRPRGLWGSVYNAAASHDDSVRQSSRLPGTTDPQDTELWIFVPDLENLAARTGVSTTGFGNPVYRPLTFRMHRRPLFEQR